MSGREAGRPPGSGRALGAAAAAAWLVALGALATFAWRTLSLPPEVRVGWVPDDGYYYLVLARHFGELGRWTFDGGFSETSGFHPLFAFLLVPVAWIADAVGAEFDTLGIALSVLLTAAAWCVPLALAGRRRTVAAIGAAAVFVAWPSLGNAVSIVEWPLVVAIDATLAVLLVRADSSDPADGGDRAPRTAWFVALGVAGSLARTDFGLWPVALAGAALLVRRVTGGPAPVRPALAASAGAVAGLVVASVHHGLLSGSFVQSSVLVKSHWVAVSGGDVRRPLYMVEALTASLAKPFDGPVAVTALAAAVAALVVVARRARGGGGLRTAFPAGPATLAVGSVAALAGYVAVYSRNGDVQPWYSAHLVTPVAALFACGVGLCVRSGSAGLVAASCVSMLALAGVRAADALGRPATWPHQADMMMAGVLLRAEPGAGHAGRVGAWNAGVLSYHQGGTVVNLDGLVNNDAARAVVAGRLEDYVVSSGITRIADFPAMLTEPALRARGGYPDGFASVRLEPEIVFDAALNRDWRGMTVFRVVPAGAPAAAVPVRHVGRTPGSGRPLRWGYELVR